jgi:hypothetical protein
MTRFAQFLAVTVAISAFGAWIITLAVPGELVARSVWISAAATVVIQLLGFSLVKMMQPANVIAGWGLGMILRLFTLVLFGMFGVRAFGLAMAPAMLSLAAFLFVSTLIEPVFLKP